MALIYYTIPIEKDKEKNPFYMRFTTLAKSDKFKTHSITDDPVKADIILFVDTQTAYFENVRNHHLTKKYPAKTFILCQTDKFIPFLPGLYTSLEQKRYSSKWVRSFHYFGIKEEAPLIFNPSHNQRKYLYSFLGSFYTSPVRRRLQLLNNEDSKIEDVENLKIKRRSGDKVTNDEYSDYKKKYIQIINDSHFVLCPRGFGTSSFRLFESMLMGRAPVIISDQWVSPDGPRWDEFSIRVKERDVLNIPEILEERRSESKTMGLKARKAWEEWFSDETSFHRIVEWLLDIKEAGITGSDLEKNIRQLQILIPFHLLRYLKKKVVA